MTAYGLEIESSRFAPLRDLVGSIEPTPAGNVALRIGQENEDGGWHQIGYVVLTRGEALAFADELTLACEPLL